jgi:hypothetical protein
MRREDQKFLGNSRLRREDNIKTDLEEECEHDSTDAQYGQCLYPLDTIMNVMNTVFCEVKPRNC